jgi:anti-sigma regulatory factor (Ser/Thr protein kinase)
MDMREVHSEIHRESDVFTARTQGKNMADEIGFGEVGRAEIEIVISELGTNIIRHGGGGMISFRQIRDGNALGMEIKARDDGPGIPAEELSQPCSGFRGGSLGIGLSGVRRLMDEYDMETGDRGTIIRTRKWLIGDSAFQAHCSVLSRPCLGEKVSGDAFFLKKLPFFMMFGVIDALGHGASAHQTALTVVQTLEKHHNDPLMTLIELCHKSLKGTRGAAMSLVRINFRNNAFDHVGVGNVETRVYGSSNEIRPLCANGTLGMNIENARVEQYPYDRGACIVMFSDGISGRFTLGHEILRKTPQEISGIILSRYGRWHDDATVMVIK